MLKTLGFYNFQKLWMKHLNILSPIFSPKSKNDNIWMYHLPSTSRFLLTHTSANQSSTIQICPGPGQVAPPSLLPTHPHPRAHQMHYSHSVSALVPLKHRAVRVILWYPSHVSFGWGTRNFLTNHPSTNGLQDKALLPLQHLLDYPLMWSVPAIPVSPTALECAKILLSTTSVPALHSAGMLFPWTLHAMVWISMPQRPVWVGHQPVLLLGRGGNFRKGGLIDSLLVIWECDLEGDIRTLALLSLCLPVIMSWAASSTMCCLTTSPKAMGPIDHGMKPPKL